jgi:DNA-binding transcriptional LysR family regulator
MKKLPLNLMYLKYFCDAVKQGSISASARENFVSQSAISQAIGQLEKALGKELITHQANRFKPTQEGLLIFEKAKHIFHQIGELERALIEDDGVISGRIEFACMHSFALALLPKCLQKVKKEWPKLHVNFRLAHTDIIREWIKKDVIDFGIVLDNEDLSAFDCVEIYQGKYRLYVAKKQIKNRELPFILSEERIETNLLKKSYRKYHKQDMDVLMEVSSWEVIANLTEEGLGIGFFPDYVALKRRTYLADYNERYDPIPYKIYAIFPKNRKVDKNIEAFLDILNKTINNF